MWDLNILETGISKEIFVKLNSDRLPCFISTHSHMPAFLLPRLFWRKNGEKIHSLQAGKIAFLRKKIRHSIFRTVP